MSLAECRINQNNVNIHLQKVWNFLIKFELTKTDPKVSQLKPIRVIALMYADQKYSIIWPLKQSHHAWLGQCCQQMTLVNEAQDL